MRPSLHGGPEHGAVPPGLCDNYVGVNVFILIIIPVC